MREAESVCARVCMTKWAVAIKFANRGALCFRWRSGFFSFVIKACLHTPLTSLRLLGCLVSGSNPAFVADMDPSVSGFNSLSLLCFSLCLALFPFLARSRLPCLPHCLSVTKLELSSAYCPSVLFLVRVSHLPLCCPVVDDCWE